MTDLVEVPAAPVVPPFPALGAPNFNEEAYDFGSAMPGVSTGVQALAVTAHTNATAAKEQATAAAGSATAAAGSATLATTNGNAQVALAAGQVTLATTQASNAATSATNAATSAATATEQAALATSNGAAQVALASGQVTLATAQADAAMGYRDAAGSHAATATTQAGIAASKAAEAAASAASISSGPVTSVGGATGVVQLKTINSVPIVGSGNIVIDQSIYRSARTSNTALAAADKGKLIDITAGTFTQTFAAAATLGDGWWCYLRNSGTGDITLDPDGAELIDGLASYVMYPGEVRLVQCDGVALRTVVMNAFYRTFTLSGTLTKAPGYRSLVVDLVSGGGGGGGGASSTAWAPGGGGGGGGRLIAPIDSAAVPASVSVTVGAGGVLGALTKNGTAGGNSSFGGLHTVFGGAAGAGSAALGGSNAPYAGGGGGGLPCPSSGGGPANVNGLGAGWIGISGAVTSIGGLSGGSSINASSASKFSPDRTLLTGSSTYGGGAGGGAPLAAGSAMFGGDSMWGAGGGGGGAYFTVDGPGIALGVGSGGVSGSVMQAVGALMTSLDGTNGADAASLRYCGGGGAGGNTGGAGGNGGYPGGGGGGGSSRSNASGGIGGNGAAGRVVVYGVI